MTDSPTGPAAGSPTERLTVPPRRPRVPGQRRRVLRALDLVKGAVLGTVITIGATAHVSAEPATPPTTAPQVDTALEQLMADHRCTTTGFPDGSIPGSSLLRNPDGELRVVSFTRGWAALQGTAPGELVAVCLDPR